ncbi:hypothetical protein ABPG72_020359, partial [Tetrahymena utriculariae]
MRNLNRIKSYNGIKKEGALGMGKALQKCQNLSTFHLKLIANHIKDDGLKELALGIANCQNLKILSLDNQIEDLGVQFFGKELEKNINLNQLTLGFSYNLITKFALFGQEKLQLSSNLQKITIELIKNKLDQQGAVNIGSSIIQFSNLTDLTLDLSLNKIGDETIYFLASQIIQCADLFKFQLNL